ncbi:hypothetical protein PWP93_20495 [Paraburkholderia sp. A1RI-2L]|uniref:hypothetical protein n=1 Tax=Paraburkholderia sp. A1RI-2L TaxID=3028367 RepID=UPI003B7A24CF
MPVAHTAAKTPVRRRFRCRRISHPRRMSRLTACERVERLRSPGIWPDKTRSVRVIETHLSWVFLTSRFAWKMKKPVRHAGSDLRALGARERDCRREFALNRRLAPRVYLAVVPLTLDRAGALAVNGSGRVVDWLVQMRRLPASRMLDCALAAHTLGPEDWHAVAATLAAFYDARPRLAIDAAQYRRNLGDLIDANERDLCDPALQQDARAVAALCDSQRDALAQLQPCLERRVRDGRIVEGHGDLRPEHVCLVKPIQIIDCLTQSKVLRTVDCVDEIAFLALECERVGAGQAGRILLREWRRASGDRPEAALVHFYQSLRAAVRARLAALHLREKAYRGSPRWIERTHCYLLLARLHLKRCRRSLTARAGTLV